MKKIASIILILTIFSVVIVAQTDVIRFPKGKSTVTLTGKIGSKGEKNFTFKAKEGQQIIIKITSPTGKVGVEGFGFIRAEGFVPKEIDGITDAGENSFTLVNTSKKATTFKITVTIK